MSELSKRIVILGGGFGGLYTALRLNEFPWRPHQKPEIILVDQSDRFLFTPLLYELMTEEMQSWEIAPPFAELLEDTQITFRRGCVTQIDIDAKQVQLDNSTSLNYDRLVIALGGKTPLDVVPGAKEYAMAFRTLEDAYRLRERLKYLENAQPEKIRVAVVGGGYSGVELACKLADRLGEKGRIRIIEKGENLLSCSAEFNRQAALKALEDKLVWLDLETMVEEVTSDNIALEYKGKIDRIPVDVVLWTVGTQVSPLIKSLPLQHDHQGRIISNAFLQAQDHPDIYILGDIGHCEDIIGQRTPPTAQAAIQQSDYCGWNIWASLTHHPLLPMRYQSLGEMITLGVDNATLNGFGMKLDGPVAYLTRRLIYLYRLPTLKHQLAVGFNWITRPLAELLS